MREDQYASRSIYEVFPSFAPAHSGVDSRLRISRLRSMINFLHTESSGFDAMMSSRQNYIVDAV